MDQLKFIWNHLGRLRKWILAGCLFMTKATDILGWLPDRLKQHLEWLFPAWGWTGWLVIFLCLLAAFSIEESYFQQHPQQAYPGKKNPRLSTYVLVAIALFWVINVAWLQVQRQREAPSVAQGVPLPIVATAKPQQAPQTDAVAAAPLVHRLAKPKKRNATPPVATTQAVPAVTPHPAAPAPSDSAATRAPNPNCTSTTNWKNVRTSNLDFGIVIEDGGHCDNFDGDTVFENGKTGYLHESPLDPRTGKPYFQPAGTRPSAPDPSLPTPQK
jgi:hypothetical protein